MGTGSLANNDQPTIFAEMENEKNDFARMIYIFSEMERQ
mgnify:CR=1 FL=1